MIGLGEYSIYFKVYWAETKPNSAIITGVAGDALELQIDFFPYHLLSLV